MSARSACLVGLIGWPVEHSVSPAMHNTALEAMSLSGHYTLLPTPPDKEEAALGNLKTRGCRGAHVTVLPPSALDCRSERFPCYDF